MPKKRHLDAGPLQADIDLFQRHQLRAIRRNLDVAREAVQEFDRDAG